MTSSKNLIKEATKSSKLQTSLRISNKTEKQPTKKVKTLVKMETPSLETAPNVGASSVLSSVSSHEVQTVKVTPSSIETVADLEKVQQESFLSGVLLVFVFVFIVLALLQEDDILCFNLDRFY